MWDFLSWLFDTDHFVRRGCCGDWSGGMDTFYQISNLVTAFSYYLIPAALFYLYVKRRNALPKPWIFLCFVVFISLCGTTHILDWLAFSWPAYRFFTLIEGVTALISLGTACILPFVIRHFMTLKTPAELDAEVAKLTRSLQESQQRELVWKQNMIDQLKWQLEVKDKTEVLEQRLKDLTKE